MRNGKFYFAPLLILMFAFLACSSSFPSAPASVPFDTSAAITPAQALAYVGERTVVCGRVVAARYARASTGSPTFINLGVKSSDRDFTILIWGKDRPSFPDFPEVMYDGKQVCVRGLVMYFDGKPEMQVKSPDEMAVKQ